MREMKPTCDPNGVYSVKRVCAELGISYKTLRKYRESGYIKPLNPGNVYRPLSIPDNPSLIAGISYAPSETTGRLGLPPHQSKSVFRKKTQSEILSLVFR